MEGFDFLSGLEDLKDDVRTTYKYNDSIDPSEYSPEDIELEVDSFILDDENRDKDGRNRDDNDDDLIEEKEEVEEDIEEEFPDNSNPDIGKSRSFEDENLNNNQNKKKVNDSKRRRKIKDLEEQDKKEKKEKNKETKRNQNKKTKEEKKINKNEEREDKKNKKENVDKEAKKERNNKEVKKDEKEAMKELLSKTVKKDDNKDKNIDDEKPLYEQIKENKDSKDNKDNKDNKKEAKNKDNKDKNKDKNKNNNNNNDKNKNKNDNNRRKNRKINKNKNKDKNSNDKKINKNKKRIDKNDKRYILYKDGLYIDKKTGESLTLDELKEIVYSDQDMSIKDEKGKIYDKDKSHNKEYKDELINKIKENKDKKNKEIKNGSIDKNKDKIEDENRTKTVIQKGIPVVSSGEKKDNKKKKEELKKIFDNGEEKEKSLVVSEVKTEDDIFVEEALESRKKRPKPPIENTFIAEIFLVVEELFENLRFYKLSPATMYKKVLEEDISPADILAHIITASFLGSGLVNVLSHFNILGRSDGVINSMATRKIRFAFTIIAIAPMLKLLLIALLGSVFNIKRDDDRNKYRDTFKYIIINSYSKFLLIFLFNIISVFAPAISIVVLIPIVLKGGLKDIFNVSGIFKKRDVSDLELTIYITLYYVIILAILRYLYLF